FSIRRRHTRSKRDWSSDVCSSDLFFAHTADHLFGEVWSRPGLSHRDRRLLLLGALTAQGNTDVADIQVGAALGNGELTPDELERSEERRVGKEWRRGGRRAQ